MVMQLITDLSGEMLILSILIEVVGSAENKEDHGFLDTLLVTHTILGMGALIREAIKVSSSQP